MALSENVLTPDSENRVPGELVITLSPQANQQAEAAAASAASGEGTAPAAGALGVPAVDQVLAALQPASVDKVHDELPEAAASTTGAPDPNADLLGELAATYLVKYDPEKDPAEVITQLQALSDAIVDAEPNYYASTTIVPDDTDWSQQWGPLKIRCPEAWETTTGSADVTVAVVDTGVDLSHPELHDQLLTGRNFVDVHGPAPAGWHYVGRTNLDPTTSPDTNAQDEVGHGTHVAGIIGAAGNNGAGVAGIVWQCKILPVRVLARTENDADPSRSSGSGTAANIAAGIRWAADQGAKVINLSLGGYGASRVERNAVAYARNRGALVVAAMGNDHTSSPMYPAAFSGVLAVGSIGQTDDPSSFSNSGSHMGLCAPGEGIHSTYFDYATSTSTYADLDGTSMATPHVSGVAALVLSASPSTTADDVASALRSSARVLAVTDATQVGAGCVDALGALRSLLPIISGPDPENQPAPPDPEAVASNDGTTPSGDQPADQPPVAADATVDLSNQEQPQPA